MNPVPPQSKRKTSAKRSALGPIAIIAGAALLAAGGYYYLDRRGVGTADAPPSWIPTPAELPSSAPPTEPAATAAPSANIAEGLQALAREASAASAPGAQTLAATAASAAALDAATQAEPLGKLARSSSAALVAGLAREAGERTARVARLADWADPRRLAPGASARQRAMAASLHRAEAAVVAAAGKVRHASDPLQAIAAARTALATYNRFGRVYARAYTMARAAPAAPIRPASAPAAPIPAPTAAAIPISAARLAASVSEFKEVLNSAKAIAGQVAAMGRAKPRSADGEAAQAAYRLRQDNAARARQYVDHLRALSRSLRGAKTDAAAQNIVAQARTVRGYLVTLQARSTAAMPPRR